MILLITVGLFVKCDRFSRVLRTSFSVEKLSLNGTFAEWDRFSRSVESPTYQKYTVLSVGKKQSVGVYY